MIVAFTGSAQKLTEKQSDAISSRIARLPRGTTIVTGACIGVDSWVAQIASWFDSFHIVTIVPTNRKKVDPDWRMFCDEFVEMAPDSTYRDRNTEMVRRAGLVIGYPETFSDGRDVGSGSWMTIRIAKRMGRDVEVYPLSEIV